MMWSDCTFSSLNGVSILLLTVICMLLLHLIFSWKRKGLPPGPKYHLPFIGNLHQINPDMRVTLRKFRKDYGNVYSLYMGTKLVIVISGFDAIKEAFVRNGDTFSNRPTNMKIIEKITKGQGIVHISGDLWKEQRRFALQTLKSFGMGRSILEEKIHGEVLGLIQEFEKCHNSVLDPKLAISTSIANIISSLCFGGQFKHNDQGLRVILEKLNENFYLAGFSAVLHFIPALELLPGDLFHMKKVIANEEHMFQFVKEEVKQHIDNYDEHRINDFTSAYIKEMKNQASNTSTTYTVDQLAKVIIDLFAAGTETTSTALRWALVYLVNYPDLQEEMYEAILKVTGTERLPSLQEKTKLPQVDAFMMEVMRHAQLVFTSLAHATTKDIYFRGFLIPPDAVILPDVDSVNHDSAIWGDPDVFRPSRYISNDNTLLNPEEFIAFFLGKRNCLGESLAKMELFLFLSAIVQNFKITAPPGEDMSLKNIDGLFGLTHSPKDFHILIQSRKS